MILSLCISSARSRSTADIFPSQRVRWWIKSADIFSTQPLIACIENIRDAHLLDINIRDAHLLDIMLGPWSIHHPSLPYQRHARVTPFLSEIYSLSCHEWLNLWMSHNSAAFATGRQKHVLSFFGESLVSPRDKTEASLAMGPFTINVRAAILSGLEILKNDRTFPFRFEEGEGKKISKSKCPT